MIDYSPTITAESEIQCIIDFVQSTWDYDCTNEQLSAFITAAALKGRELGRAWLNDDSIFTLSDMLAERKAELIQGSTGECRDMNVYHDVWHKAVRHIWDKISDVKECSHNIGGRWDYSITAKLALRAGIMAAGGTFNVKPKGWDSLSDKDSHEIMESFDFTSHYDLFRGIDSSGVRSGPLPERLALPHVRYAAQEHGRKPLYTLASTVMSHMLGLCEAENSYAFEAQLKALWAKRDKNIAFTATVEIDNPHMQIIMSDFDFKTDEEQRIDSTDSQSEKAMSEQDMLDMTTRLLSELSAKKQDHEMEREAYLAGLTVRLKDAFPGAMWENESIEEGLGSGPMR